MFLSSFCSTLLIWVSVSFLSLLVPCTFSFISLSIAFIFSSNLWPKSTNSVSILITSVLNCAYDRLLSLHCLIVFFLDLWTILSFGLFFLVSAHLLCSKEWSLKCSPAQVNAHHCTVTLYLGEGPRGNNGACSTLCQYRVTSPTTHKQIGPFWCWFPVGRLMYILGPCGSLQRTLLWGWEFLPLLP